MIYDAATKTVVYDSPPPEFLAGVAGAKALYNGFVAAPASLDNLQMCVRLGLPVPPLIAYNYDWPRHLRLHPKPFRAQLLTANFLTLNPRAFVLSDMGCVDADTEYLSREGWKRIADYETGDVAQYHPAAEEIEFVAPTEFVKRPCAEMIRFKTTRGVDQLLSPEHRVLLADGRVISAEHIAETYGPQSPSKHYKFRTTFKVRGTAGVALTDAQIRLQVAVNADGHCPPRVHKAVAYVRLKKPRKIERMTKLLADAGVAYKVSPCAPEGFVCFRFAPPTPKGFDAAWWACSQAQLEIVADEITHWDGNLRKAGGRSFSSATRADADFAQYAYSASGCRATLNTSRRFRRGRLEAEHVVHAKAGNPVVGLYGVTNDGRARNNVGREPSPDGFKYCFVVPSAFLILRRNGCVFATGNTGKSLAALWAADYVMRQHPPGECRCLIVAPLSTLRSVWADAIFTDFLGKRDCVILHGDAKKRAKLLEEPHDFYIINHDGLGVGAVAGRRKSVALEGFAKTLSERTDIRIALVDECSGYRDSGTRKSHVARAILSPKPYLWMMSGTPTPNSPVDAYGQALLVNRAWGETLTGYRSRVMQQISPFKWVPRRGAAQEAAKMLSPSIRFSIQDCMDLPPCTVQRREAPLTPEQAQAMDRLKRDCKLQLSDTKSITVANEGVLRWKLIQVASGAVYDGDHFAHHMDVAPRLRVLEELIAEAASKFIIFAPLTSTVKMLYDKLSATHSCARVDGSVSYAERSRIFQDFQTTDKPRGLIAHPQTMAHGLTLTEADLIVWWAPIDKTEIYLQGNKRIDRPGQKRSTRVVQIVGSPIEAEIYRRLESNETMQGLILKWAKDK